MTKRLIIIIIFLANICYGQGDLIGLFGKCNNDPPGTTISICQQVLFNKNKTFTFYEFVHLNHRWNLSDGTWKLNGDTVILNSIKPPFLCEYKGTSSADSITICITEGIEPLPFANLTLNAQKFETSFSGIKYPRKLIDTLYVSFITTYSGPIIIDKEKVKNADTIVVQMDMDFYGKYYFNNVKWLLQNNKLFHSQDEKGKYMIERYFEKAEITDLKYRIGN